MNQSADVQARLFVPHPRLGVAWRGTSLDIISDELGLCCQSRQLEFERIDLQHQQRTILLAISALFQSATRVEGLNQPGKNEALSSDVAPKHGTRI